jgi:hypothetical protein
MVVRPLGGQPWGGCPYEQLKQRIEAKDDGAFWRSWRSMQGKSTESSRIDGFVSDGDIADHFAGHFQKVFEGMMNNVRLALGMNFRGVLRLSKMITLMILFLRI